MRLKSRGTNGPGRIFFFITVIPILFFNSCVSISSSIPWDVKPIRSSGFYIYPEPGMPLSTIKRAAEKAEKIRDELVHAFFPDIEPFEIGLILYNDSNSYDNRFKDEIESLANYRRGENVIHIPVNADTYVWRHELSHAIMENAKPGSPYWLHEGLAYFVFENYFPERVSCNGHVRAKISPVFQSFLPDIRKIDPPVIRDRFNSSNAEKAGMESAISAYFVVYLWQKELLSDLIKKYLNADRAGPMFILSNGNPRKKDSLMEEFKKWLKTDLPDQTMPGC